MDKASVTSGTVITAIGQARFEALRDHDQVLITLESGRTFLVSPETITRQPDGQYWLDVPLRDLQSRAFDARPGPSASQGQGAAGRGSDRREEVVLPVVEEEAVVSKRDRETARVSVRKVVREIDDLVETVSRHEHVDVKRMPVNEFVAKTTPISYEENRVVIPIYEEVVVTEKRLLLKEKVVITVRQEEKKHSEPITRRVEEVLVDRQPVDKDTPGSARRPGYGGRAKP
jgi:stress response protein YsnF